MLDTLSVEIIVKIIEFMVHLDIDGYAKVDIEFLDFSEEETEYNWDMFQILQENCRNVVNLSLVNHYFNNIICENALKVFFSKTKNVIKYMEAIKKYKPSYIIAPYDTSLEDEHLKILNDLSYGMIKYLFLHENTYISYDGLRHSPALLYFNIDNGFWSGRKNKKYEVMMNDEILKILPNIYYYNLHHRHRCSYCGAYRNYKYSCRRNPKHRDCSCSGKKCRFGCLFECYKCQYESNDINDFHKVSENFTFLCTKCYIEDLIRSVVHYSIPPYCCRDCECCR